MRIPAFLAALALSEFASGQLLFTSGTDTTQLLFERVGGQTVAVNTGAGTHDHPGLSRDGRFVSFSVPDPVAGNGINPSSDIYLFDRALRTTRRIINHSSGFDGVNQTWSTPLSSQLSPNGAFLAYGVELKIALGGTGAQATNELNIADPATGIILSNPTWARGPTSDAFAAEFRGISFAADSQSFVTPLYRLVGFEGGNIPVELPTIVRFVRNPGNGEWELGPNLSQPTWQRNPNTFLASATVHMYPALSPSDAALAYFSAFVPDASTGSQAWTSRVVIANSNGGNASILTSFIQGYIPTGLAWTADGTALVVSVSEQFNLGSGFLPVPRRSQSFTFSVATADGALTQLTQLGNAMAPMLPLSVAPPVLDLTQIRLRAGRSASGGIILSADGIPSETLVNLQTSQNSLSGFTTAQQVSGAQMAAGLEIPLTTTARFFRLSD